jgi:hypothetical protein
MSYQFKNFFSLKNNPERPYSVMVHVYNSWPSEEYRPFRKIKKMSALLLDPAPPSNSLVELGQEYPGV